MVVGKRARTRTRYLGTFIIKQMFVEPPTGFENALSGQKLATE